MEENIHGKKYSDLEIGNIRYKTILTKKYLNRKPYKEVNIKEITAFLPGTIAKVFVKKGRKIKKGEKLLILETMKMKNNIVSSIAGVIDEILVKQGEIVSKDQVLIELK
jgi:biotin carboxyl carrier protein